MRKYVLFRDIYIATIIIYNKYSYSSLARFEQHSSGTCTVNVGVLDKNIGIYLVETSVQVLM
jgi:hypothetical protein